MPGSPVIGVIAALEQESAALFAGQGQVVAVTACPIREIHYANTRILVATSGVGKVNAAMAATMLAAVHNVTMLLIVGTAGRVAPAPGAAYWLAEAVQHDFGAQRSNGFTTYNAGSWPIGDAQLLPLTAMPDPGSGLPSVRIVSGDAFVECPDHARRLSGQLRGILVDMESAAVAQVAAAFGLPWGGVKSVTDDANGESAGSFQDNLRRAANEAAAGLERTITAMIKRPSRAARRML